MRVLIAIPRTVIPAAGPAYVAACLKRAGHYVRGHVYEGAELLRRDIRAGYDVLMTGGLSCSWKEIEAILGTAKEFGLPTVLGGGIVTAEPEIVIRTLKPAFGVLGQAEITAVEVMEVFQKHRHPETVDGLAYLDHGRYVQTAHRGDVKDLDGLPFPDYDIFGIEQRLDNLKPSTLDYLSLCDHPREYPLVASRSCPFHCTFCWHTSGEQYRRRSVNSVMVELEQVVPRYRINLISILDELFGCSREWLVEFCNRIEELRKRVPWELHWWAALRAPMVDAEILRMMRDAGCVMIGYGFESYSKKVLESMAKRIKPADIERAYRLTREAGLATMAQFIFGDPAETQETIDETLAFWRQHRDIFLTTIWVCPDSPNYRLALKRGIIKDRLAHQRDIFRLFNLTAMSDSEYRRFAVRLLKINVLDVPWPKAEHRNNTVKAQCPHCQRNAIYGNFALPRMRSCRVICRNCLGRFFVSRGGYRSLMRTLAWCMPEWVWPYAVWRQVRQFADRIAA